jgi:hypothetical protein
MSQARGFFIVVAVPVLNRPGHVAPLIDALDWAETRTASRLLFIVSPNDKAEIDAIEAAGGDYIVAGWEPEAGDYAKKINLAVRRTKEPWILMGADDICFCPNWSDIALRVAEQSGARVIGTNDVANPRVMNGSHSTHPLVARSYIEEYGTIDRKGIMLCEEYDHNYVDDELVWTAKARGEWAFAKEAEVPHSHPDWGTAPWDDTYTKGKAHFHEDQQLFTQRSVLWRALMK